MNKLTDNTMSSNAFFQVNKVMLKYLGSAEAAILLPEFIYSRNLFKSKGEDQNGWWFVTKEYLMEQTGFSEYILLKAEKLLESKGILKTQLRGLPRKKYFFVNDNLINDILSGYVTQEIQVAQPESQPKELNLHTLNSLNRAPLNLQVAQPKELTGNNIVENNNIINKKIEKKKCVMWDTEDIIEPYSSSLVGQLLSKGRTCESIIQMYPEYKTEITDIFFDTQVI